MILKQMNGSVERVNMKSTNFQEELLQYLNKQGKKLDRMILK